MRKILYISTLILSALACGLPTALAEVTPIITATFPAVESPAVDSVEMMVIGDLNIRTAPGEKSPLVQGKHVLHAEDVVIVTEIRIIGESRWCLHERGWSNCRWLLVAP